MFLQRDISDCMERETKGECKELRKFWFTKEIFEENRCYSPETSISVDKKECFDKINVILRKIPPSRQIRNRRKHITTSDGIFHNFSRSIRERREEAPVSVSVSLALD